MHSFHIFFDRGVQAGKAIRRGWLRFQGVWMIILFLCLAAWVVSGWYRYSFLLGANEERMSEYAKAQQFVDLDTSRFEDIRSVIGVREERLNNAPAAVQDIFRLNR